MQMSAVFEVVGTTGSLIVCASAIPQAVKTYRIKRSRDLSIVYLGVLMLGMGLLQSYSLYVRNFVFILGNTLSMISTGLLIVLWFRYREKQGKDSSKRIISHRPAVAKAMADRPTQTNTDQEQVSHRAHRVHREGMSISPVFACTPNALIPKALDVEPNTHACSRLLLCLKEGAR